MPRDEEPFIAGDRSILRELMNDTAHVAWIGDSITAGEVTHIFRGLRPVRWKGFAYGFGGQGNSGYGDNITIGGSRASTSVVFPPTAFYSLIDASESKFTADQLFGAEELPWYTRVAEYAKPWTLANRQLLWRNQEDILAGGFTVRVIYYTSPTGCTNKLRFKIRIGNKGSIVTGNPIDFHSSTPGFIYEDFTVDAGVVGPEDQLDLGLYGIPGQTVPAGQNGILAAIRFQRSGAGMTISDMSWGSSRVSYWDPAGGSPYTLNDSAYDIFTPLGITHAIITLTNNGDGSPDADLFVTRMTNIITAMRTRVPDMKVLLRSSHESTSPYTPVFTTGCRRVAEALQGVCMINGYRTCDSNSVMTDLGYLLDTVHPSESGRMYTLSLTQGLIEAGASAPLETDVRFETVYGAHDEYEGSCVVPYAGNVRANVPVDHGTGSLGVPDATNVRVGTTFGSNFSTSGLLDLPSEASVREGVVFDHGTKVGALAVQTGQSIQIIEENIEIEERD